MTNVDADIDVFTTTTNVNSDSHIPHITRFPPEPNGYLHMGHLKAMMFDFDLFKTPGSKCILRMDDTNPEAEKEEYVKGICDDVKWLGYHYSALTYTSDYFPRLYDCAIELIKMGYAYVDFSSAEEIKSMRHTGTDSKDRTASVETNLKNFENMKKGKHEENGAVLRLKIDMQNDNHSLRDPIAYRIKYTPHIRTKSEWCIYPSYDYSHGLVDAFELITDSFCTMEFYVRREQYYWPVLKLKDKLNLTPAKVLEFGRLNIESVELSKRKIIPLVDHGIISGFDDPRLYTIKGMRRRGFSPEILKKIVSHAGMGRTPTTIAKSLIDYELRTILDRDSDRVFAVMDPLLVKIVNNDLSEKSARDHSNVNFSLLCDHPNHPVDKVKSSHTTELTENILIEKSDFREKDSSDYYRLAPGKVIRLRYADFVEYVSHDEKCIIVRDCVPTKPKKIKGVIHWVKADSHKIILEVYDDLYNSDGEIKLDSRINRYYGNIEDYAIKCVTEHIENSDEISNTKSRALVFQFERLGYFKFDRYEINVNKDTDPVPVFIRVIDLADKYNK